MRQFSHFLGLSCSGHLEEVGFVRKVDNVLHEILPKDKIFFWQRRPDVFIGPDAVSRMRRLFGEKCRVSVAFLSETYLSSEYCIAELQGMRGRTNDDAGEGVLLFAFGEIEDLKSATEDGFPATSDICCPILDHSDHSAVSVAELILRKLGVLGPSISLSELKAGYGRYSGPVWSSPAPINRFESHFGNLFRCRFGTARSLRLLGNGAQSWSEDEVTVRYIHDLIDFEKRHYSGGRQTLLKDFIAQKAADARAKGYEFFNAPCGRLISFSDLRIDIPEAAMERTPLEITLGPVGWYDYEFINNSLRNRFNLNDVGPLSDEAVDELASVLPPSLFTSMFRDFDEIPLSNICETATTVITKDNFLIFSVRPNKGVSVGPNLATAFVAENINRYKDDKDADRSTNRSRDYSYEPVAAPSIFGTVSRGFGEEISPLIRDSIRGCATLSGIAFELIALHPSLLFYIDAPFSKDEIIEAMSIQVGVDHQKESKRIEFVPLTEPALKRLFAAYRWTGSGLASVIRALEIRGYL